MLRLLLLLWWCRIPVPGDAASFAPGTKWELHEAVARCLGGCTSWDQHGTESSRCISWTNQTQGSFSATSSECRLLASADVSRIARFSDLFSGATSFNQDLSNWDVSSATDMQRMFYGTHAFGQRLCSLAWERAKDDGAVEKALMFGAGSLGGIYCCPRGDRYDAIARRCYRCSAGLFQDETNINSATCKACPAGTFTTFGVGQASREQCLNCGAGRYSDEGPGQYQAVKGAAQYSEVCKPCRPGRYSLAGEGQTTIRVCRACEAGRYQDVEGSYALCKACVGGRYSDEGEAQVSEATCKNCAANTWMTPASGLGHNDSLSCAPCKFGRHSNPGLLAEECEFDYFAVLGPVLGTIFCMLAFVGIKAFKRKVWDVAFGSHEEEDDRRKNHWRSTSWKSVQRRTVTQPSPARTVALMKQAKKQKKKKRPRPVAAKPEIRFGDRLVGEII